MDPESFASQLQKILAVRRAYDIAASRQIQVPEVQNPGLLVMVHELPAGKGIQITALNFGATPITETLNLPDIAAGMPDRWTITSMPLSRPARLALSLRSAFM